MTVLDALGFVGLTLLLSAFVLNQMDRMSAGSLSYNLMNALGGYILTYYAIMLGNIPFTLLEFVWGSVAFYRVLSFSRSATE